MVGWHRRIGWPALLALSFAVHLGMTVSLSGRLQGAAFAAAQAVAALALAAIVAGRPVAAVRAMDTDSRLRACAAGLLGVLGPLAVVTGTRMSDAPAGSVVVFWVAGGWALIAAGATAVLAARRGDKPGAAVALSAGMLALAGVAGVVANWERPSSFSPLVRFPVQEITMLAGGMLLIAGAYLLLRAARGSALHGVLVCATGAAAAGGLVWMAAAGFASGLASLAERPVHVALAGLAWGVVCLAVPRVARESGPALVGGMFAVAPVLLSALTWLEQLVGVAGPQPLILAGVTAGSLTAFAGIVALRGRSSQAEVAAPSRPVLLAASVPLVLALVALTLPAIEAHAEVSGPAGAFSGSWTLLGWESVQGLTVFALAALVFAFALARPPRALAAAALVACAAWPLSLSTPMHVLTGWLPPGLEQYYGTEYASVVFTGAAVPVSIAAATACAVGYAALLVFGQASRPR